MDESSKTAVDTLRPYDPDIPVTAPLGDEGELAAVGGPRGLLFEVVRMVLSQRLVLTLVGVAVGLVGAIGLGRFLSAWLYKVTPTDLLTYGTITLLW